MRIRKQARPPIADENSKQTVGLYRIEKDFPGLIAEGRLAAYRRCDDLCPLWGGTDTVAMTFDIGEEVARHAMLKDAFNMTTNRCDAYAPL